MNTTAPACVFTPSSDDEFLTTHPAEIANGRNAPVLGEWYWVLPPKASDEEEWLGCAMKVGSNFVEIHTPHSERGHSWIRVHVENFWTRLRHEPRAPEVIRRNIAQAQGRVTELLADIERVTRSLGMTGREAIGFQPEPTNPTAQASSALMVLSSQADPKVYSSALQRAKTETLPALFDELKSANAELATWMKAPIMATLAQMRDQRALVDEIDGRIFNVSLYAGLTEEAERVADGVPAAIEERLHVMQRMVFMDESFLANYRTGGMEFEHLADFDAWLSEPENRDSILPFPRCLVAMRVRRDAKVRDWGGSIRKLLSNFEKEKLDRLTFLYVRNGDQLWRINTELDFEEMIFPDPSMFNPNEPKMVEMFGSNVKGLVSRHWWEQMRAERIEKERLYREWEAANKHRRDAGENVRNPHYWAWDGSRSIDQYEPLDPSSVYYDDAMALLDKKIKYFNRCALIIQGLFDRSMCLHPHLPAKTWTAEGFDQVVKLVEDGSNVLHHGEPPDFEAYRARCNASLREGSLTVGQEDYWERLEAEREGKRRDRDWRDTSNYRPSHFRPYGNPGPGHIARIARWKKGGGGKAVFEWERDGRSRDTYRQKFAVSVEVPASALFNLDAYQPGDFVSSIAKRYRKEARTF